MISDVAALLAPIADDAPCGPDLSYDPDRQEIEKAFDQPFSIDTSGNAPPPAEIDWEQLVGRIVALLGRSKDIWLAVYLCRAGARGSRLDVVELGAETLSGLLSQFWAGVHPVMESEADIEVRRMACDTLGKTNTLLVPLGRIPILSHPRLGNFGTADLERLRKGGNKEPDYDTFMAVLAETGDGALGEADVRFGRIATAFRAVADTFREKSNGRVVPDLAPAEAFLAEARRTVRSFIKAPAADKELDATKAGAVPEQVNLGQPKSREDVVRALDAICEYYRKNEPSSPVPVLLDRAKGWVHMPFLDVLADIAPESLQAAKNVLAKREKK